MGLFSLLYPEQIQVIQHWHQVKSISYQDESMALQTVLFSLLFAISKNEKSIVVVQDEKLLEQFRNLLDAWHLKGLYLQYNPNQSVTKDDINDLQSLIQYMANTQERPIDLDLSLHSIETKQKLITDILQSFHQFETGRNLFTVLERMEDISGFEQKTMVHALSFEILPPMTENEFDRFYDQIIYAASLYEPRFYQVRQVRQFMIAPHFSQSELKMEEFIHQLSDYIIEMENLKEQYFTFMNETLKEHIKSIRSLYAKAQAQIEDFIFIDHLVIKYKKLESGKTWHKFFTKDSDQVAELLNLWKKSLDDLQKCLASLPDFHLKELNLASLEKETFQKQKLLEEIQSSVDSWYFQALEKQKIVFKHTNVFNQREAKVLHSLEAQFHELIHGLNQKRLLSNTLEINTLSLQKQTELLNRYIQECRYLIEDVKENKRFYLWDHFINNISENLKPTIEALQRFPVSDWATITEYVYLKQWTENRLHPRYAELMSILHVWFDEIKRYPKSWAAVNAENLIQERKNQTKNFSGIEKSLLQKIMTNKDLDRLNWRYFFEQNGRFWSDLFNIIITPDDKFEDLEAGLFTNLLYINPININTEVLHLGKTIHTYYPQGTQQFDLEIPQKSNLSEQKNQSISALQNLEKTKILAANFYSVQKKFTIFQSKKANVISCLYAHLNNSVFESDEKAFFKELNPGHKELNILTESILESSRLKYLIVHDNFLDPGIQETYGIQQHVLEEFESYGFNIISLNTPQLIENYAYTLRQIRDQIHQ